MITNNIITEIICTVDEFIKYFESELENDLLSASSKPQRLHSSTVSNR